LGSITFNGEELSGLPAFAFAVGVGGLFGVFFGLILAGIARLLGGRPNKS
jgi:hypothetical protein